MQPVTICMRFRDDINMTTSNRIIRMWNGIDIIFAWIPLNPKTDLSMSWNWWPSTWKPHTGIHFNSLAPTKLPKLTIVNCRHFDGRPVVASSYIYWNIVITPYSFYPYLSPVMYVLNTSSNSKFAIAVVDCRITFRFSVPHYGSCLPIGVTVLSMR